MRYPALWVTCSALGLTLCGPAHAGSPGCDDPTRTVSTGGPQIGACHQFDGNPTGCATAYHTTGVDGGGAIASCFYNAQTDECDGCGPWNEAEILCTNSCVPGCSDPSRTVHLGGSSLVVSNFFACGHFDDDQAGCEASYHTTQDGEQASCWFSPAGECLGCGSPNEDGGFCTNACALEPGAEIPMAPPYALILFGALLLRTSFLMLRGRLRSRI